jgi:bacteriocin-like protein
LRSKDGAPVIWICSPAKKDDAREEKIMSEENTTKSAADEMAKAKKPGEVQLTEKELSTVTGGAVDAFIWFQNTTGQFLKDE